MVAIRGWLIVAALATGCAAPRPNLLLIVVDTLRADHVGAYDGAVATPAIDSLAAAGTMWERAYTPCPRTTQAVASLMTGLYPQTHGVRVLWGTLTEDQITLAEVLGREGFNCGAVVTNHILDRRSGLAQGFHHYDVAGPSRTAAQTTSAAIAWIDSAGARRRPFMLWVHYFDPHMPYAPPREDLMDSVGQPTVDPEFVTGFGGLD
ncbi:MAG: sulfatase-like hydrolase/transferase, partial [Candidatus Eisenbacteria bacterium]|nr:sulfatase-like hydrolase/transferase [Candidatus Eisenbacteria bacterium]